MIVKELLARLGLDVDESAFARAQGALGGLTKGFAALVGAATAVAGVKLGFQMAREAAQFEDALRIFTAAGQSLDEFRDRAKGTLSDTDLVTKFNFSSAFGVAKEDYLAFIDFSDAAAKKLGKDQKYVFNSIVTGVARLENRWTDNAGMIINKAKVYADYAKKLGLRSSKDLTVDQQRKAFIEDLRRQGQKMMAEVKAAGAGKGNGSSDFYDTWDSTFSNLKLALGGFADAIVKDFAAPLLTWVSKHQKKWMDLSKTLSSWVAPAAKAASIAFKMLAVYGIGRAVLGLVSLSKSLLGTTVSFAGNTLAAFANAAAVSFATRSTLALSLASVQAMKTIRAMTLAFLSGPIAIGAAALLIAAIVEELYSMFSTKVGAFETLSGKWGIVSDRFWDAAKDPNKHPLLRFLNAALAAGTKLIDLLDRLAGKMAQGSAETDRVLEGSLNSDGQQSMFDPNASGMVKWFGPTGAKFLQDTANSFKSVVPYRSQQATAQRAADQARADREKNATSIRVDMNINANGASAADKELAGNVAREVQSVTDDQVRRAQAITTPTPSGARTRGSSKGL